MSFFKRLKDKFSTKSTEDIEQELSEEEAIRVAQFMMTMMKHR